MSQVETILATTHIDSQQECLTRGALDGLVETITKSFVPVGIEHDPRIPPQGRITSAIVRERVDGEFEVFGIMEIFQQEDEALPGDDMREIVMREHEGQAMVISYDWNYRFQEDQSDIASIAEVFKRKALYEGKKSADPISIIGIAGAFILGSIAAGFLKQIGVDGWNIVKEKLGALFARRESRHGEQLFKFSALVQAENRQVEIDVILTSPTSEELDQFVTAGLHVLDLVLPIYLRDAPDVRRIVFEAKEGDIEIKFAVRKDCRALKPSLYIRDILSNMEREKLP